MGDKFDLKDYLVYIIPGYVYLLVALIIRGGIYNYDYSFVVYQYVEWISHIGTLFVAYILGHIGAQLWSRVGKSIFDDVENEVSSDKEKAELARFNEIKAEILPDNMNSDIYYKDRDDDRMRVILEFNNVPNRWTRIYNNSLLMKHMTLSTLTLLATLFIVGAVRSNEYYITMLIPTVFIMGVCRSRYHKFAKEYVGRIRKSFVLAYDTGLINALPDNYIQTDTNDITNSQ